MFKVNNENIRTTSMTSFSGVSMVDFEQVNVIWVGINQTTNKVRKLKYLQYCVLSISISSARIAFNLNQSKILPYH